MLPVTVATVEVVMVIVSPLLAPTWKVCAPAPEPTRWRAVELGLLRVRVISADKLLEFGVEVGAVAAAVKRFVLRLDRQFAHALQHVGDGGQRAFGGLRQRDTVVGVADRDVDAADLRVHAVGDRQAGGVVLAELTRRPGQSAASGRQGNSARCSGSAAR